MDDGRTVEMMTDGGAEQQSQLDRCEADNRDGRRRQATTAERQDSDHQAIYDRKKRPGQSSAAHRDAPDQPQLPDRRAPTPLSRTLILCGVQTLPN
jgi:hypothetical protein